ncbi:MAG TPA: hypothetical protein VJ182_03590 [Anaerolineales bacterium]|nr:hypothetical protein [Anaerolineales bacterium]
MDRRWIRASDIGDYLYCQRSWWYRLRGARSTNTAELALGTAQHAHHGRGLRAISWVRLIAIGLILLALLMVWMELAS